MLLEVVVLVACQEAFGCLVVSGGSMGSFPAALDINITIYYIIYIHYIFSPVLKYLLTDPESLGSHYSAKFLFIFYFNLGC